MQGPTFAPAVPGDAPLVVRAKPSTRVLAVVMLVAVVLEVVLLGAVVWLVFLSGFALFLALLPLFLFQIGLMVLILREYQGLLGPQLAATASGVWVRTGLGRKPEVVHLPWAAIDAIDVARGPALRIMSRQGDALFPRRAHWRARSLRRRFGTPFIVDGRRSATEVTQLAAMLDSFGRSGPTWSTPPAHP